ncbi:MAG TPA: helix-turn-helix domain-containing protein [Rhodanobacteraceae bacterium]|nr:helix-turn-helix domain-containing protein [Rhodanobacteraceae bacterium]
MNTSASTSGTSRPLAALGISAEEERAYRALLSRRLAGAGDVAPEIGLEPRATQHLLDALAAKGLATHSPEQPPRYMAVLPEFAVEAIVSQRHAELERARAAIADLSAHASRARDASERGEMVELVTSRDAERRIFEQAQQVARHEVVTLVRPPLRVTRLDTSFEEDQVAQRNARSRGVRYRSIVDGDYLALPGAPERVRLESESGEEIRVFPELPFKVAIFDRRTAFIPLDLRQPDGPTLLVRSSALLDALYELFESLWQRSTPIAFNATGVSSHGAPVARLPEAAEKLIPLLAAGLNDKAIAHELDISSATLNRRLGELMKGLDARTRFQMGWRAALEAFPERCTDAKRRDG